MLIDWFTVGAQALNFIILVWLMKRFLYKPVQDAIAAREKRIADQIAAARKLQTEAEAQGKAFRDRSTAFDRERADLLARATADAGAQRERLIGEARQAADSLAAKRRVALRAEAEQMTQALVTRSRHEVFDIVRKTLADLADASLEARMAEVFARKLRELPDASRATLGAALKAGPAVVRSGVELPEPQREAIRDALRATFAIDLTPRFETAADGVAGVELRAGGQALSWSIDTYLESLESVVTDLFPVAAATPAAATPGPAAAQADGTAATVAASGTA
jgi:F-type H+-transporting ATPase subunit b